MTWTFSPVFRISPVTVLRGAAIMITIHYYHSEFETGRTSLSASLATLHYAAFADASGLAL